MFLDYLRGKLNTGEGDEERPIQSPENLFSGLSDAKGFRILSGDFKLEQQAVVSTFSNFKGAFLTITHAKQQVNCPESI